MTIPAKVRVAFAALVLASGVLGATIAPASAQTVAPGQPAQSQLQPTSLTLKANISFESAGSPLTRSGVVSPHARGVVVVYDEAGNKLGRAFVLNGGVYQLTIPGFSAHSLTVGVHTLTAVYLGNDVYAGSSSAPITEVIFPHW